MPTHLQDVTGGAVPRLGETGRSSPHCRFCKADGRETGCVACDSETERAYKLQFPNGPQPLTFATMDEAAEKLTGIIGGLAAGNRLTRTDKIHRELENVERIRAGLAPIEPNAALAELEAMTDEEIDKEAEARARDYMEGRAVSGHVLGLLVRAGTNEKDLPPRVIPPPPPPPIPPVTGPNYLHLCGLCGKFHIVPKPASKWDLAPYPRCCGQAAAFQREQEAPPAGFHWIATRDDDGLPTWTMAPTAPPIGGDHDSPDKPAPKAAKPAKKR